MTAPRHTTPLRLGFLSPHNPFDRRTFSGTAFYAATALRQNPRITLTILGGHRRPSNIDRLLRRASPKISTVDPRSFEGLDAVVGLVASKLVDPDKMIPGVPFLHVTDATPAFLRDCYGWDIPTEVAAHETKVAKRADALIYSSLEMARRATTELGAHARSIPFGTNIDPNRALQTPPEKPSLDRLELLFVGNDWARKGGEIAVGALNRLTELGVSAHLTVIGRLREAYKSHPNITWTGYLNKNRPDHLARLNRLYAKAHLLVLPSRADCTPMVVGESMAHATPVLASETGGLATLLGGTGTGRLLPLEAGANDWARAIRDITADPISYQILSDACFDRAATRLSWAAWCTDILSTVDLLSHSKPQRSARIVAA